MAERIKTTITLFLNNKEIILLFIESLGFDHIYWYMLHHNFSKGTHILIIFRDGTKLDCKFVDRKAKSMITDKGEFLFNTMRATTIFKHKGDIL